MKKWTILMIITIISVLLSVGCTKLNAKKETFQEINVEKDSAEELDINLSVNYGKVNISSGAKDWVDGEINYNFSDFEPKVAYKLTGDKGKVAIDQPKMHKSKIKKGQIDNRWDLKLTNDIPIDLTVETGASDTKMDLQGLKLHKLAIESGVGRATVDLSGSWEESFDVNLEMGVGQTTIILPKEVGVKIKAEKGIGDTNFEGFISEGDGVYVNDAFESADVIITVHTEIGVGEANFELER